VSEQTLDVSDFMERVQGDKELFFELLDIFSNDFPIKRRALKEAIANKDSAVIEHVSHFLKGSCGNISAAPLRTIFNELEQKGKTNELEGLEGYLEKIDREYDELMKCVEELRIKFR